MAEPLSLPPVPEPPKGERLKNKVVLLTGAAQGIGEAIVATFASQQAKLVISDIQGEKVENVAAQWRGKGADVVAIKADVSQQQDLQAMARLAVELHGRIDVLVNCAGGTNLGRSVQPRFRACSWLPRALSMRSPTAR